MIFEIIRLVALVISIKIEYQNNVRKYKETAVLVQMFLIKVYYW